MVRKSNELRSEKAEGRFGGEGFMTVLHLAEGEEELNGKGRLFARTTLLPGHSIGYHVHEKDSEIYYVVGGRGEFSDNGEVVTLHPGDVAVTPCGSGHSIKSVGEEPLEFIALILYA